MCSRYCVACIIMMSRIIKKDGENGLDISEAKVGMFVCGNSNVYAYTNKRMTIGLIIGQGEDSIYVMIIRNTSNPHKVGECYCVSPEYFYIIDIKRKRLSQDEKSILNLLSKKGIDTVDGFGRHKYNVPILEIIEGLDLSWVLMYSDKLYDLKEPLFTY